MGLIYIRSESADLMDALNTNIKSGKEVVEQLKAGSQKVVAAVDGKNLSGSAYTAGKGLFKELIIPTIDKVTAAIDELETELLAYRRADQQISGEGTLNEDRLKQRIAEKKAMKTAVDASLSVVRSVARNNPVGTVLEAIVHTQSILNQMAATNERDIQELQNKVRKLHQFSMQTTPLFHTSLSKLKLAMQGVTVLNHTVVNSDGTYQLPTGVDSSWFNQLKNERECEAVYGETPPDVGDRECKLLDLGYGKLWFWVGKGTNVATSEDIDVTLAYNKWLSRMLDRHGLSFIQGDRQKGIDEVFYQQSATLIKEVRTGIDSVTGKKLTTAQQLGKASLLANSLLTMGVMVKGLINVGKTQQNYSTKGTVPKVSKNGKQYSLDRNKYTEKGVYKKASGATGIVWDDIKGTQPVVEGTSIPKSFEMTVNGEKFWVNPNGTKHMIEYSTRNLSHGRKLTEQQLLTSLQASTAEVVAKGYTYNVPIKVGNWELIFSPPRQAGQLPVIKHAQYIP